MLDGVETSVQSSYVLGTVVPPQQGAPPHSSGDGLPPPSFDPMRTSTTRISEKSWSYATWLFLCQVYALSWKQYLMKKRRPLSTLFEILAPSIMLLILVYGTQLSPSVPVPAFVYNSVPNISTNATTPYPMDNQSMEFISLLQQFDLYRSNDPVSYFQLVFLPLLGATNSTLATQLSNLMFANRAAAQPFIIPGFDSYISMMFSAKVIMSRMGLKSLQHLEPLLWHVMNNGYIAFVTSNQPRDAAAVGAMIAYFNATTTSFGSLVLCMPSASTMCGGFSDIYAAEASALAAGVPLWAIVLVDELNSTSGQFSYTIRMNQTLTPDTNSIIDRFPQGLGTEYANYIYSGFTTIQFELNEYFRRLSVSVAVAAGAIPPLTMGPGVVPLFESACNGVVNASYPLFATPDFMKGLALQAILGGPPQRKVTIVPGPVVNVFAPCYSGMIGYCSAMNTTDSIAACLAANNEAVGVCAAAIQYAQTCEATFQQLCGVSVVDFFTIVPNPVTDISCWAKMLTVPTCSSYTAFGDYVSQTLSFLSVVPCAAESAALCGTTHTCNVSAPQTCPPDYDCLVTANHSGKVMSASCNNVLLAVSACADDIQTICPFDPTQVGVETFPTSCLHQQSTFVSTQCLASAWMQQVELLYGTVAIVQTIPNTQYYCTMSHQVSLAFTDGIAAGAFPARAYDQNQFYANSGALIGLVVALSFLYPFTAHVRLIVQERSKQQRLFLMLVGVHHSAILTTYTIIGFVTVFFASLFATVVLGWVFPGVTTDNIFSLLFTYGFSLIGLASFIASFFSSTRHSGAIAPFVMFLFSIPAFVVVGEVDWITYVLPPSVTILAADLFVGYSQSSATPQVFQNDLNSATRGLFGLAILYLLLALLVEQYRILSTSIGRVGRFSKWVNERLFGAYRYVLSPFRKTRVYQRLNMRPINDDEGAEMEMTAGGSLQEEDAEEHAHDQPLSGGSYGYENYDDSTSAAPVITQTHRLRYEIGGVDQDGMSSLAANDGHGGRPRSFSQVRSQAWKVYMTAYNLCLSYITTTGSTVAVKSISALFYQHRVNCIIGGTGSGKSTLLRILMGEWAPDAGRYEIDGSDPTLYNRQNVGVCLQNDVSWDQLTVSEHIELVQLVKGCINLDLMKNETKTLLSVLNLEEKKSAHADTLSIGMLRKLNVAMCFAGGSRILFLDEPTASMDPLSRKAVWHLLGSNAKDRCIVVSTSCVEELDDAHHLLLLNDGTLRCSGTPHFLKSSFGSGFILSVNRGAKLHAERVLVTVKEHIPTAQLVNNVGQELCFRIPYEVGQSITPLIAALKAIEGISSVSVSDHRLDEVFMRVTREQGVPEPLFTTLVDPSAISPTVGNGATYRHLGGDGDGTAADRDVPAAGGDERPSHAALTSGNSVGSERERASRHQRGSYASFRQCFAAIFAKRFAIGMSTFLSSLLQFIIPLVCISLAMDLLNVPVPADPKISLDVGALFGTNDVLYSVEAVMPSRQAEFQRTLQSPSVQFVSGDWPNAADLSIVLNAEMDNHDVPRYGALVFNDTFIHFDVSNYFNFTSIGQVIYNSTDSVLWNTDTILHNTSSPHALPGYLALLGNIRLLRSLNKAADAPAAGYIHSYSYPLPYNSGVVTISTLIISIISSILLLVPFTFFPAQFVASIVKERETGLLDAEFSSLLTPMAYWLATFTWNMCVFSLFAFFAIILYASSPNSLIDTLDDALFTWVVLVLYGACVISISYLMSKVFRKHTTAQNGVTMFHFTCGFVLVVAANAINLLPDNDVTSSAKNTNDSLMVLFRFLPTYALGESFIKLSTIPIQQYLHSNLTVREMIAPSVNLMLLFPLYLFGLIFYEQYGRLQIRHWWQTVAKERLRKLQTALHCYVSRKPWDDDRLLMVDDDPTVATERARALDNQGLNAVELWRKYGDDDAQSQTLAVQNVALHVGRERLVIVGPNGAGKTSLLRCMGGVEPCSAGYVTHRGHNMSENTTSFWEGRSTMGFAGDKPRAMSEFVSPFLLLRIIADLRGIRATRVREQHLNYLLSTMGLWSFRNQSCKSLSLAVQRRVAVAVSLVGYPDAVVLDEPSTGLDPVGRRQFWATLQSVPPSTSLLMSSQWNEDVEMLATRVAILDEGKIKQIGPVDDLRIRARNGGVSVTVFWRRNTSRATNDIERHAAQKESLAAFFLSTWPQCQVADEANGWIRFRIGNIDDSASSSQRPSPTTIAGPTTLPPTATPASPGMSVDAVFARVLQQRYTWAHDPVWASSRPSSPTDTSAAPLNGSHDAHHDVELPFEFDVSESSFGVLMDAALGNRSNTVQHIRRMLNLPSGIRVRDMLSDA